MSRRKKPSQTHIEETSEEEDFGPSKSQIKREMTELQKLGEAIIKLPAGQYESMPLDEELKEAMDTARRIKHREGLRRQMQYVGKLMRKTEIDEIKKAFQQLQDGRKEQARAFHELEQLRDSIIEEGLSSIEAVIEKYPQADRQQLRQLVLQINKEKKNNKPPAAARKLFKYLRELSEL